MENLFVFAVLLFVQCSYGYPPDSAPPEKIKLTSEPRYYYPDQKSDHLYEHLPGSSKYDAGGGHQSNSKEEDATPNYDFYKPHELHHSYGPSEEDSKYIPHSKTFSKYITPKKNPSSEGNHALDDQSDDNDDTKKSEGIPIYGYKRENYHHPDHKHVRNEDEDSPKHHAERDKEEKHSEPFKHGPNYSSQRSEENGDYKHYEYHEKHRKNHPEQKAQHGKHHYPEEHEISQGRQPYPEHREEPRIHYRSHHYPQHKEDPEVHHGSRYYPEHREEHSNHHERHHHPQLGGKPYESHHRAPHDPEHKEESENHHGNHHPRYQHWSDKNSGSFPIHNTDKWIEELGKSKSHHVPSGPEGNSKHKVFPGVPHAEEFLKEHKLDSHKSPTNVHSDKPPYKGKKHTVDSSKGHSLLKHYPYVNKYHREYHIQPFRNYKPNFNLGGHRHGWMYTPKFNLYQELRKDLDIKMRLLKEHEQKLAELQKGHLEKYWALFKPHHHSKMFRNQELPKPIIPNFDHKHHPYAESHEEKHEDINPPHKHHSSHADYPKEQDYPSHKSKHPPHSHYESPHLHYESPHPHYESPLPKHDSTDDQPKHYNSRHYKDDYAA